MSKLFRAMRRSPCNIRKPFGKSKHQKLSEDWSQNKEPVMDGVTFYVKYIGSTFVEEPNGVEKTAEAVKQIIAMAKASGRKLNKVSMTVCPKGITVIDLESKEIYIEISIYRISYCTADGTYDRVFAFIATNKNETLECMAFLCTKRKMAQAVTLTVAQSFNIAFEQWKSRRNSQDIKLSQLEQQNDPKETLSSSSSSSPGDCRSNHSNNLSPSHTGFDNRLVHLEQEDTQDSSDDTNLDEKFSKLAETRSHHPFLLDMGLKPEEIEEASTFDFSSERNPDTKSIDDLLCL